VTSTWTIEERSDDINQRKPSQGCKKYTAVALKVAIYFQNQAFFMAKLTQKVALFIAAKGVYSQPKQHLLLDKPGHLLGLISVFFQ
jgi:hypothetical protein